MRISDLRERILLSFGPQWAPSFSADIAISELGSKSVNEALAAGLDIAPVKEPFRIEGLGQHGLMQVEPAPVFGLRSELLEVIKKYVQVNEEAVKVNFEKDRDGIQEVLDIQIALPDKG